MGPGTYVCSIEAEPLEHYVLGGYHPTHLGDLFKDGRYKVIHKLGYGSHSTVWLVRDIRLSRYVAMKIQVSAAERNSQEIEVMRTIAKKSTDLSGDETPPVVQLLDDFVHVGPNGHHICLVLELLGQSVYHTSQQNGRLPAALVKEISRQVLQGLNFLYRYEIGHGDIHARNIAFALQLSDTLSEREVFDVLKTPMQSEVTRQDGLALESSYPRYLVAPVVYDRPDLAVDHSFKIIDFGESFMGTRKSTTFNMFAAQAPEVVFETDVSPRIDLWNAGCLIFELVTGQYPFVISSMLTKAEKVQDLVDKLGDLPIEWQPLWKAIKSQDYYGEAESSDGEETRPDDEIYTLQEWLEELYFDSYRDEEFTEDDLLIIGELLRGLLHFKPQERLSAEEALQHAWFQD